MCTLHHQGRAGRRPARRALERLGQDRMRHPRAGPAGAWRRASSRLRTVPLAAGKGSGGALRSLAHQVSTRSTVATSPSAFLEVHTPAASMPSTLHLSTAPSSSKELPLVDQPSLREVRRKVPSAPYVATHSARFRCIPTMSNPPSFPPLVRQVSEARSQLHRRRTAQSHSRHIRVLIQEARYAGVQDRCEARKLL